MDELTAAGTELSRLAKPFLRHGDWDGLAAALESRWSPECLEQLLRHSDSDLIRLALLCLGVASPMERAAAIASLLHHDDATLVVAAEESLWSVWFRGGSVADQRLLRKAVALLDRSLPARAVPLLDAVVSSDGVFAEAFHQRSIARYMLSDFDGALDDAARACRLNKLHFAAWAAQGNCHVERSRYDEAMKCYRAALAIHPRFDAVRQSIRELRERLPSLA